MRNMTRRTLAILIVLILTLAGPIAALAVQVDTYAKLREAAEIGVADIEITQDLTYDGNGIARFTNDVKIYSTSGEHFTITGNDSEGLIEVGTSSQGVACNLTLSDLTLTGGNAYDGGAVFVEGDAQISGCSFENNTALVSGGAVYIVGNGTFEDVTFTGNESEHGCGGGVYVGGDASFEGKIVFEGNTTAYEGGGAYIEGDASFEGETVFEGNTALIEGGGAYVGGKAEFDGDTLFEGNEATHGSGGGAYVRGDASFEGETVFEGNTAYAIGGGAFVNGDGTFNNTTFTGNTAGENGGGIWIGGNGSGGSSITDTEFKNNTSGGLGGSIYSEGDLTVGGTNYFSGNSDSNGDPNGNTPEGREDLGIWLEGANLNLEGEIIEGQRPKPEPKPEPQPMPQTVSWEPAPTRYWLGVIGNCNEWVSLRTDPSTDNPAVGTITKGTEVQILDGDLGRDKCWAKILYNDHIYYVHQKFIIITSRG